MNTNPPPTTMRMKMNTWMNDSVVLAQGVHFLLAYAVIFSTAAVSARFGGGWIPVIIALGVTLVFVILKEFVYDMTQELPKQTLTDGVLDSGFYVFGGAVGAGMAALVLS